MQDAISRDSFTPGIVSKSITIVIVSLRNRTEAAKVMPSGPAIFSYAISKLRPTSKQAKSTNRVTSCFIHVSEFCPFVSRPLPQLTTKKSTSGSLVGTNAAGNPIFFMRNSIYTVHIHFKGIIFIAILNIVIIQIICHDCHQKNEVDDQRWRRRRTSVADSRTDR